MQARVLNGLDVISKEQEAWFWCLPEVRNPAPESLSRLGVCDNTSAGYVSAREPSNRPSLAGAHRSGHVGHGFADSVHSAIYFLRQRSTLVEGPPARWRGRSFLQPEALSCRRGFFSLGRNAAAGTIHDKASRRKRNLPSISRHHGHELIRREPQNRSNKI